MTELQRRRPRLWVLMYKHTGNAGLTCRRCGISRSTLRKWAKRYAEHGKAGLASRSSKPHTLQPSNVDDELKAKMLHLRQKRNLGPKRIQAGLMRHEGTKRSISIIYKVLKRAKVGALKRQRKSRPPKRCSLNVPGERVQIDSMKVASGLY